MCVHTYLMGYVNFVQIFFLKIEIHGYLLRGKCNALTEYWLDGSWSELLSVRVKEIDVL